MVRDSVRSVSSFFVLCHTSLQKNVNGGVEPWSLVTKGKTLVTKGNDLGDEREDLDDQRKDLNESKSKSKSESKTNRFGKGKPAAKNGKGWALAQPAARRA